MLILVVLYKITTTTMLLLKLLLEQSPIETKKKNKQRLTHEPQQKILNCISILFIILVFLV